VPVPPVPALLAAVAGLVPLVAVPSAGPSPAPPLPGHTIVAVEGDAENGFGITRLDGSTEHPPTLSESTAECTEYDDPTEAAVCEAEVRTRYAGLADLQLSLRWAQQR
jgi:hypothetical protein